MIMGKRKAKVWLSTGSLFGLEDKKPNIIFISWFPKSNIGFFVHINISSHLWQLYTFFCILLHFWIQFSLSHWKLPHFHNVWKSPKRGRFSNSVICLTNFQKGKTNTERARFTKRGKLTSPKGHIVNFFSLSLFSNMRYLNANIGIERANFIHLRGSMRLGFSDRTILSTDVTSLAIVQNHRNNGFAIVSILIISVLTASNCRNCLDDWSSSFSVSGRNVGYLSQAHHIIAAVLSWQLGKSTSRVLGNFPLKSQEN